MLKQTLCPLCNQMAQYELQTSNGCPYFICKRCGEFEIGLTLHHIFSDKERNEYGTQLSGLCREIHELKQPAPTLLNTNYKELATKHPVPNMEDLDTKLEKLIQTVKRRSRYFGDILELDFDNDYPLGYAKNGEEFFAMINQLVDMNLLNLKDEDNRTKFVILSGDGWKYLSKFSNNEESKQAFIASWFNESTKTSRDAIRESIKDCGYMPMCIDIEHFKETIMDKALSELQKSRFAVIDLTGGRNSVFYEAGFAKALGIEAIFVYRKLDDDSKLDFYVKHYTCHEYKNPDELKDIVTNAIKARIK
jgi:hypothetical protein